MATVVENDNTIFADDSIAYFWGHLGQQSYRRRLIFVQRDFVRDGTFLANPTAPPTTTPYTSSVNGAVYDTMAKVTQQFAQKVTQPGLLQWHPFGTPFMSDARFEQMKREIQTRNHIDEQDLEKNIQVTRFSVIIPSLLYWSTHAIMNIKGRTDYFTVERPKQLGEHVLVSFFGQIVLVTNELEPNKTISVANNEPINGIYPVMRYEWQSPPIITQTLAFGLSYRVNQEYHEGDRYYHRFGEQNIQAGGVYEVDDSNYKAFKAIVNQKKGHNDNYTILYVCAGAKLIVYDEYHQDEANTTHNRSLIQQGGIAMFTHKANMTLAIKILSKPKMQVPGAPAEEPTSYHDKRYFYAFYANNLEAVAQEKPPLPKRHSKIVMFLGATDSQDNTSTWTAVISLKSGKRDIKITAPIGARIVAVEDTWDGFKEIDARIDYEMLYDSVLTNHGKTFKAPGTTDMIKKILNVNEERSFTVRTDPLPALVDRPHPREFNISNITQLRQGFSPTSRVVPPPMYPPIRIDKIDTDQKEYTDAFYVPSIDKQFDSINNWYQYVENELKPTIDGIEYEYKWMECMGYEFERVIDPQSHDIYKQISGHFHVVYQTVNGVEYKIKMQSMGPNQELYRIGVDGWLWKRVNDRALYKEKNLYFYRKDTTPPVDLNPAGSGLGRGRGIARGRSTTPPVDPDPAGSGLGRGRGIARGRSTTPPVDPDPAGSGLGRGRARGRGLGRGRGAQQN